MPSADEESRDLDELLEEFLAQLRRGDTPSVEEFAARHPHVADEIRELFPAALSLEDLKVAETGSAEVSAAHVPPLERLGDFRIIREIGRGGMGVVYEAEQESLGRHVALKVLLNQALHGTKQVSRFEREARLAASLHHTNIVAVYGVGEQDTVRYYVMELIDGISLDHVIARLADAEELRTQREKAVCDYIGGCSKAERWQRAACIGLSLADALQHAHEQGVLHRDIKPANVLVNPHGGVWIADFGLAKALHAGDVSQTGTTAGTLRYMAPEQFSGDTGIASDLYALGLLLYELLVLAPAYAEADRGRLIQRITHENVPRLRESCPNVPRDLDTIVQKLTAHDSQHRYPSAAVLADDLRRFLDGRPIQARPVAWPVHLWRWGRRKPVLASMVAALLVLVLTTVTAIAVGWVQTRSALAQEKQQRRRAEANASLALEVVDNIFSQFSPTGIGSASQASISPTDGEAMALPTAPVLSARAAVLLQKLLPLYDRLAGETGDERQVRVKAAAARKRIGDVQWQLGQYTQAERSYRDAVADYAVLARDLNDERHLIEQARIQNHLGQLLKAMGRTDEGLEAHRTALVTLASLPTEARRTRNVRFELVQTQFLLGTKNYAKAPPGQGRIDRDSARPPRTREAREHVDLARRELEALLQEIPDDADCLYLLALCYREQPRRGGTGGARADREEATRILAKLVADHPTVPRYRYELAQTYAMDGPRRRGEDRGEERGTEKQLQQGLAQMEWLVRRHPYVSRYATGRAQLCHKLSTVYRHSGRWAEAESHCRRAVDELAMLREQNPGIATYTIWLGAYTNALADLLSRRNRTPEAYTLLEANLVHLRAIPADDPVQHFTTQLCQQAERILGKLRNPKRSNASPEPRH
ncbi:MAG: serine/threonine protein kinase [Victivallales bacterium]|nr:serine/threonine protein kinase [Victivallales bacterium]